MEENIEQEAARFIRNSNVNVQVSFTVDYSGETLFVLRALPWKNSSAPNRMILVAGTSILNALLLLSEALYEGAWLQLDWKALPLESGIYRVEYQKPTDLMERVRKLRLAQAQSRGDVIDPTDDLPF